MLTSFHFFSDFSVQNDIPISPLWILRALWLKGEKKILWETICEINFLERIGTDSLDVGPDLA